MKTYDGFISNELCRPYDAHNLSIFCCVSYMRYALEALYVGEVINYNDVVALQGLSLDKMVDELFGLRSTWISNCPLSLFCFSEHSARFSCCFYSTSWFGLVGGIG
jgi:hypothetical protein